MLRQVGSFGLTIAIVLVQTVEQKYYNEVLEMIKTVLQ